MDQLIFRSATSADLPAIIALLADDELGRLREVVSPVLDSRYVEAFRAIEADANQRLIVVVADGAIIGTMQLSFVPGLAQTGAWRGMVEAVRVASALRGRGIGQRMFEWAIGEFRSKGCRIVQLASDKSRPDAHRFYEKLGFRATHEGYKLIL